MQVSLLIKQNRTQIIFSPESAHDKEVIKILQKYPNTHSGSLYDTKAGESRLADSLGFTGSDLIMVIDSDRNERNEMVPKIVPGSVTFHRNKDIKHCDRKPNSILE